jgi:hypothetical protein
MKTIIFDIITILNKYCTALILWWGYYDLIITENNYKNYNEYVY